MDIYVLCDKDLIHIFDDKVYIGMSANEDFTLVSCKLDWQL